MSRFLLFVFCLVVFVTAKAQSNYRQAMQQGDDAFNKQQYKTAINKYFAAEAFDPTKKDSVKAKVNRTFDKIELLRLEAVKANLEAVSAKKTAQEAQLKTIQALVVVKEEKLRADFNLAKAEKLINAFYFYNEKFALAFKNNNYGFIDKQGNIVIEYKYKKAEQFDFTGFAKVKKIENEKLVDYLVDTAGTEYKVAYKLTDLKSDITALALGGQELKRFPEEILKYPQLKILLLNENFITALPAAIGQLKALQILNLSDNLLETLPEEIGQLKKLQSLSINHNKILRILPSGVGGLKSLVILNVSETKLMALPSEIGELKALRFLNASSDSIKDLPVEIGKLESLEELLLLFNPLVSVPVEIGLLKSLKKLSLAFTKLKVVPVEIFNLRNLESLSLEGPVKVLPAGIGQMKNLYTLNLDGCQLKNLPAEIGKLTNLSSLSLMANELTVLPPEFCQLKSLERVRLSFNKLSTLPDWIKQLKNLKMIELFGNGISNPELKRINLLMPWCKITGN